MNDPMTLPTNSSTETAPVFEAIIVAGGTGGHVFPGLSIAERLQASGWSVRWIGTKEGMEAKLVTSRGIPFDTIPMVGLRGKGLIRFLVLPMIILRALFRSFLLLRNHRPDLVIGMGGYVAFAPPMVAAAMGIPMAIHEQNAVCGWVNRVLNPLADLRFSAFPKVLSGARHTGNPVVKALLDVASPEERFAGREGPLKLLIVGGSRGAHWINETLPKALSMIPEDARPIVIHQTGAGRAAAVQTAYEALGVKAEVVEFIDDMATAYGAADLVIGRAGAMTVAELAAIGVASVLVPFPYAVDDHQSVNARYLADQSAAHFFRQREVTEAQLAELIGQTKREDCLAMAIKARALSTGDAAATIVSDCIDYVTRKNSGHQQRKAS